MGSNHPQAATELSRYRDHRINRPQDPFNGSSVAPETFNIITNLGEFLTTNIPENLVHQL